MTTNDEILAEIKALRKELENDAITIVSVVLTDSIGATVSPDKVLDMAMKAIRGNRVR